MKNWTLNDLHTGQFLIPDVCSVYGDPEGSKVMARQLLAYTVPSQNGEPVAKFGLSCFAMWGKFDGTGTAMETVTYLNQLGMRLMTRDEVRFLLLYTDQCNFAVESLESLEVPEII
jgi:hypothetical protein